MVRTTPAPVAGFPPRRSTNTLPPSPPGLACLAAILPPSFPISVVSLRRILALYEEMGDRARDHYGGVCWTDSFQESDRSTSIQPANSGPAGCRLGGRPRKAESEYRCHHP